MATLSGWVEGILILVLFIGLVNGLVYEMNSLYNKNYEVTGLKNYGSIIENIKNKQIAIQQKIETGEVTFLGSLGLSLSTSWSVILTSMRLIFDVINGSWIDYIVIEYMQLPAIVAIVIRTIYLFSIMFAILSILFRVRT